MRDSFTLQNNNYSDLDESGEEGLARAGRAPEQQHELLRPHPPAWPLDDVTQLGRGRQADEVGQGRRIQVDGQRTANSTS